MNIVYLLLPLALMLGGSFVVAFIWSVKRGQYDDLETPAHRMLLEDKALNSFNSEIRENQNQKPLANNQERTIQ